MGGCDEKGESERGSVVERKGERVSDKREKVRGGRERERESE